MPKKLREIVSESLMSSLKLKTDKSKPDWKKAPKWATHLGRTHEGGYHWLEKHSEVETKHSDRYFPNAGKTEFTGHHDGKGGKGYVEPKPR
jgi:pyruvate/2-oxoglutarate dehydrogenase complex dihydrolipoamide dehydrogenase (E3) component